MLGVVYWVFCFVGGSIGLRSIVERKLYFRIEPQPFEDQF